MESEYKGSVRKIDERWSLKEWDWDSNPPHLQENDGGDIWVSFAESGDLVIDDIENFRGYVKITGAAFQELAMADLVYRARKAAAR